MHISTHRVTAHRKLNILESSLLVLTLERVVCKDINQYVNMYFNILWTALATTCFCSWQSYWHLNLSISMCLIRTVVLSESFTERSFRVCEKHHMDVITSDTCIIADSMRPHQHAQQQTVHTHTHCINIRIQLCTHKYTQVSSQKESGKQFTSPIAS